MTSKYFVTDVACGDHHSVVLANTGEVLLWGSNKDGQLGQDIENCPFTGKAFKLHLHEYLNSSNREIFVGVRAKANYTVLLCESKNVRP